MSSLFAKILVWFWCTLAIAVVGSAFVSALTVNENTSDRGAPGARLVALQLEEARMAYQAGGRRALKEFLDNLERIYGATGILTDERGRDLLTGQNRSDLILRARSRVRGPYRFFRVGGRMLARAADDGHYWFFMLAPGPRVGSWFLMPEHLVMLAVAALMSWWLALHFTAPLRQMQKAVERFGRGDLSARVNSTRRDELGRLG
ncbi:MAG TPA: HAMP domain-containing protein, partial [Bryobacteraceae bacterium]